jgi:hypothetical protein
MEILAAIGCFDFLPMKRAKLSEWVHNVFRTIAAKTATFPFVKNINRLRPVGIRKNLWSRSLFLKGDVGF